MREETKHQRVAVRALESLLQALANGAREDLDLHDDVSELLDTAANLVHIAYDRMEEPSG